MITQLLHRLVVANPEDLRKTQPPRWLPPSAVTPLSVVQEHEAPAQVPATKKHPNTDKQNLTIYA